MANIFLDANDTFTLPSTNTNDSIFGRSGGTETVILQGNPTGTIIDGNVEEVQVAGTAASTTLQVNATTGQLELVSGGVVYATFSGGLNQAVNLVFADGNVTLTQTGANSFTIQDPADATDVVTIDGTTSQTGSAVTLGSETSDPTPTPGTGQTFTLTTDADIVSGTSGDDTINGTNTTYDAGDVIVGGEGTDTLNIAASANNAQTATVTGVEAINFNAQSFTNLTYDATGVVGSGTTITYNNTQTAGATGGTVNAVTSGATVVAGSQVTGTFTVDLDSANGASVAVNAGSAGTIAVTDAGSAGVVVTSAKVGTTATPVVISVDGDGDTNTAATANDAATITAQGVVTLNTNATDQVENLTLSGNGQAATYNLDAGDAPEMVTFTGSQDVTLVGGAAQFDTETATDSTTAGTTTVKINDGAAANLEKIGADVIEIADEAAGAATYNVANNANVKLSTEDLTTPGALTLNSTVSTNTDTAETLNLEIDDLAVLTANSLNTADFETLNLKVSDASTSSGDGAVVIGNLVGSTGTNAKVNVTGSTNLTLTAATSKEIDASAFTGNLTSTLSATMNKITTGTGADVFTAYDGNFTVVGGAGNDTLNVADSLDLSDNTISLTGVETINLNSDNDAAAGDTLQVKSSDVNAATYIVKGNDVTGLEVLQVNMDAASVDLSGLVVDSSTVSVTVSNTTVNGIAQTIQGSNGADTLISVGTGAVTMNGNAGNDVITTAGGVDIINGGAGDDSLSTGAGNDSVTAGEGADGVYAGAGGDTIILTETTSAADNVIYKALTEGSSAGVAAGTFTGFDVITGFTSGTDDLVFANDADFDDAIGTDIVNGNVFVVAGTAATTASNDLTAADVTNVDKVAAFLSDGAYTTSTAGQNDIVAITFTDFTAVYTVTDAVAGGAIAATEIALIGTVDETLVGVDIIA